MAWGFVQHYTETSILGDEMSPNFVGDIQVGHFPTFARFHGMLMGTFWGLDWIYMEIQRGSDGMQARHMQVFVGLFV